MILYVCNEHPSAGLRLILSIAGYSVLIAHNSASAMENLRRHPVDLILADHSLPREFLEQLSSCPDPIAEGVPVAVLVSSLSDSARYGSADAVLAKEADPPEMLAAIARLVSKAHAARAI